LTKLFCNNQCKVLHFNRQYLKQYSLKHQVIWWYVGHPLK